MGIEAVLSLDAEFARDGIAEDDDFFAGIIEADRRCVEEERDEREARDAARALLRTAKARLHTYLKNMTLEELLDRLFRQTPALNDVRQRSEEILAKRKWPTAKKKAA